jgi:predicted nuclease of restriction endonuclease-like (RecB) superfamily
VQNSPRGFSSRLSWTHYRALLKVSDPAARAFYEIEAERENWSTPHLERQIFTALHLRLLKSRNKAGVMELARKGQTVERPSDLIKSPLILDFLGLSGRHEYRESDLETAIISKLSQFLLELGKGFAFVARQKRISFDDDHLFIVVEPLLITPGQFRTFVERHAPLRAEGLAPVTEDNDAMTSSYVMVDPLGGFYGNAAGRYVYSDPSLSVGVDVALAQVRWEPDRFVNRGGVYD